MAGISPASASEVLIEAALASADDLDDLAIPKLAAGRKSLDRPRPEPESGADS